MVTTDERKAFAARLNEALDDFDAPPKGSGRQTYLAELFGVSQKGARKWLEAEGMPSLKRIPAIARELNVRSSWLISGEGPKRRADDAPHPAPMAAGHAPRPTDIAALLPCATPRSRQALEQIAMAAAAGRLTESDLELLNQIAERIATCKE
ncbi:hypothetical protein CKO22_02215 [Thiococcus pfennigii]|nr:hypothetical protein [Thiococcus pfennigii]